MKIQICSVSKVFHEQDGSEFRALENVDLKVPGGQIVTLIGPSGCGKSTLLEILAGLQSPSTGEVRIDGSRITGPGPDRAIVFQHYALFPWRTVIDNVAFNLEMRGMKRGLRRQAAHHYLEVVGLQEFSRHYPWQLSGGMRQRVALARALACQPSVMLMDEPFGALDALNRDLLQDHLLKVQREFRQTIVFVTHSVDEALYLSDRIIVMGTRPGRVIRDLAVPLDHSMDREQMRAQPMYTQLHKMISQELYRDMADGILHGASELHKEER